MKAKTNPEQEPGKLPEMEDCDVEIVEQCNSESACLFKVNGKILKGRSDVCF
jgi:hypothetical protein